MAIELSDSMELVATINTFTTSPKFWSRQVTNTLISDAKEILFEKVHRDYRRLAPFVAPNVQGKIQRRQGGQLVSFRPAYVKPKDVVDPSELRTRLPGEDLNPFNPTSMDRRRLARRAEILQEHRRQIENTIEWMAAEAIIKAQVTVEGDDYPATTVDFQRDPRLTEVLTGDAVWGNGTGDSLGDLKAKRKLVKDLTGANITDIYFGQDAWDKFYADNEELFKDLSDLRFRGSDTSITRVTDGLEDIEYMGFLAGQQGQGRLNFFVVSTTYLTQESEIFNHLDANGVVGFNREVLNLTDCYGAIEDLKAGPSGLAAMKWFSKNWESEDPSHEYILTQSAPIVVPGQPNASFYIQVA